jgi:hypothetical protein
MDDWKILNFKIHYEISFTLIFHKIIHKKKCYMYNNISNSFHEGKLLVYEQYYFN